MHELFLPLAPGCRTSPRGEAYGTSYKNARSPFSGRFAVSEQAVVALLTRLNRPAREQMDVGAAYLRWQFAA